MKEQFQKYNQAVQTYLRDHQKDLQIAIPIVVIAVVLVGLVVLSTIKNAPNIVYKPIQACEILTKDMAHDLLGDRINGVDTKKPVITGNTAVSKCSYSDLNAVEGQMKVVAVAVRNGINDKGVAQNKAAFTISQKGKAYESVKGLGDSAYFDQEKGQLNVLDGKRWIIVSYGYGATPQENSLEQEISIARDILKK